METTSRAGKIPEITGLDLAGYLVGDPARAIAFYRDVLGLAPTHVDDQGRGAKLGDPLETPVCFMAFGDDPDGNGIIIHQRKARD